ncbi:MAG: XdhC family protein, partial [Acidobacteria bacterium]|nr:XdhC family protein [Acidobacteriota bacterium]
MPEASEPTSAARLTAAIRRVLNQSSLATLATLVASAHGAGAKLLVEEDGARTGTLGDEALDEAAARRSIAFLSSRAEAATQFVREFAPELENFAAARIMFERIEPEPRLVICGAGHVGASLARLARLLGYNTTLIDDRADFVTRERFPDEGIELIAAESWTGAVRAAVGAGRNVSVAVVTRG